MCLETIETENIIFSYLDKNRNEHEVNLSTLMSYVSALQEKFKEQNKSIYINYTRTSLVNAIMAHLDLLDLENNTIHIVVSNINKLNQKMDFYNSKLPYEIRSDYMRIFDVVDKEIKQKQKQTEYV
jgi:hypothetical protein